MRLSHAFAKTTTTATRMSQICIFDEKNDHFCAFLTPCTCVFHLDLFLSRRHFVNSLIKGVQHMQKCFPVKRKFARTHLFAVNRAMSQILQLNPEFAIVYPAMISLAKCGMGGSEFLKGNRKMGNET